MVLHLAQSLACLAGGISRASAFVLVAKWRSRERISEEDESRQLRRLPNPRTIVQRVNRRGGGERVFYNKILNNTRCSVTSRPTSIHGILKARSAPLSLRLLLVT